MGVNSTKIAIVCNYELLPERVGGMDYFFWLFDEKCKANNIQVDWFFPNTSTHGQYPNLTIIDCNYEIESHFTTRCSSENYSHIITHFVELCTGFFKTVKEMSNANIIVIDHNPRPLKGYPIKKRIQKRIKGILYSKYIDTFIGVSNYTVNEIIKDFGFHLKNKTKTIYNGVVIESIVQQSNRKYEKPRFLVVSHLRKSKGIQDLIAAVHLLPTEIKDEIIIDIYGDGPYKDFLVNKVNQLGVNLQFKGSISNLNEIYCHYDYLLQPTHMECFSLSILESLAANVPVITTSVGGNEEAVADGQNGYIFHPKDSNALKGIIEKLYIGTIGIQNNTRSLVEKKFSITAMVENHFKLLQ